MVARKIAWTSRTLAPWCAAAGLLISFTADAGQETAQGASRGALSARAVLAPSNRTIGWFEPVPVGGQQRSGLDFKADDDRAR